MQSGGAIELGTPASAGAIADAGTAYDYLAGLVCPAANALTGQNLGAAILEPGVYCFTSNAELDGTLHLANTDSIDDPVWIIQIATSLLVTDSSTILFDDDGEACDVYFQVGTSATLMDNAVLPAHVLTGAAVSLNGGASIAGRAVALTEAITMMVNTVGANKFCAGEAVVWPCDALSGSIGNGTLDTCAFSLAHGESCSIDCNSGYTIVGDDRECNNGTLMGDEQTCFDDELIFDNAAPSVDAQLSLLAALIGASVLGGATWF
jgi:hypothetical protein